MPTEAIEELWLVMLAGIAARRDARNSAKWCAEKYVGRMRATLGPVLPANVAVMASGEIARRGNARQRAHERLRSVCMTCPLKCKLAHD